MGWSHATSEEFTPEIPSPAPDYPFHVLKFMPEIDKVCVHILWIFACILDSVLCPMPQTQMGANMRLGARCSLLMIL